MLEIISVDDGECYAKHSTVPFRSIRPGGGQGDRLAEICMSAILRVDRGHFPDFGQSKSSAACASSSSRCRTDPPAVSDLAKAIDLKCHVNEFIPTLKRRKFNEKMGLGANMMKNILQLMYNID